ncbi:MAG TPA: LytTR family DNA-binding domain-containing protein [Ferruginibacter sp.]|nr:LytTR family DNA-binding domain-containing protein [Ferruginibacter sp.]HRE63843.1 LytTR family DNA-binding domain-containing protein [Ferruginibacter sp.]
MNKIKAIIIDDEEHASARLTDLVEKHCNGMINLLGSFHSVKQGIHAIKTLHPHLVFLDVQIHDETGFDLLQQLPNQNFEVIFVTAYEKYAVQAFKFSAIYYLLKPVDIADLKQAVEKIKQIVPAPENVMAKFQTLLENVEQLKQYTPPKKIVVPTIAGFELLPVIDILRCQSDINYTSIFMRNGQKLVVAKTLKEFEEMLTEFNFFRVHNSHLINLAYVKSYNKGKGGTVILNDGTAIEVSTRRKEDFLHKMLQ